MLSLPARPQSVHLSVLRSGKLLPATEATPVDEEIPQCYRKWQQLPPKVIAALLAALGGDVDFQNTLDHMHHHQDRLHLLAYLLQLSPDDKLPHGCRTFAALQEVCVDRYRSKGSLLSLPGAQKPRRVSGKGVYAQ